MRTSVDGFAGRGTEIAAGVAPDGDHGRWVLAGASGIVHDVYASVPTVWTSEDRVGWTATVLPIASPYGGGRVDSIMLTQAGYVAVGTVFDQDGEHDNWTSLSADGLTWVELPPVGPPGADSDPASVADGPAGILGIGAGPAGSEDTTSVWQLRRRMGATGPGASRLATSIPGPSSSYACSRSRRYRWPSSCWRAGSSGLELGHEW